MTDAMDRFKVLAATVATEEELLEKLEKVLVHLFIEARIDLHNQMANRLGAAVDKSDA